MIYAGSEKEEEGGGEEKEKEEEEEWGGEEERRSASNLGSVLSVFFLPFFSIFMAISVFFILTGVTSNSRRCKLCVSFFFFFTYQV